MNAFYRSGLLLLIGLASIAAVCQQATPPTAYTAMSGTSTVKVTIPTMPEEQSTAPSVTASSDTVVLSGTATTARIADPNEPVVFSGRVMRMADYVAAVSSNNAAAQHPRTPEMRNREKVQPVPPSPPSN
jgi:hypothetical protein